jgi:bifunctional DNA-binding transcriptional regulator/antitoxin component of YhaV-PrlF toxin-antitoxin module
LRIPAFGGLASSPLFRKLWPNGFNSVGPACDESCLRYVAGYISKKLRGEAAVQAYDITGRIPPYVAVSQGLGKDWCLSHADDLRRDLCLHRRKYKVPLPRYYRKLLGIEAKDYVEYIADSYLESFDQYFRYRLLPCVSREQLSVPDSPDALRDYPLILPAEGVEDVSLYLKRLIVRKQVYKHLTPEYKAYLRTVSHAYNSELEFFATNFPRGRL